MPPPPGPAPVFSQKIILAVVVLAVLTVAGVGVYVSKHKGLSLVDTSATIDTPVAAEWGIVWKSLIGAKPTVRLSTTTDYDSGSYTSDYDAYALGTFTKGEYASSMLYVAKPLYKNDQSDLISDYMLYIGDAKGTPVAWWGSEGISIYGIGDFDIPTSLANAPKLASTTLPLDIVYDYNRVTDSSGAAIAVSGLLLVPKNPAQYMPTGSTVAGNPIVKTLAKPSSEAFNNLQQSDYYSKLPFEALHPLILEPNFIDEDSYGPPHLTWQTGSTQVASYNYGHYVYGISECFVSFKTAPSLTASFIRTGTTNSGDPVYEINPKGNDDVYQCLYQKIQRYDYDSDGNTSSSYHPQTYDEFLKTHPVFFWKHQYGEWMVFGRSDVVPAAEKGKPVIYLYPTKTQDVSVKVDPIGGFTKTDPAYGNGWNVRATPQGVLTSLADGLTYPYLFWEGGKEGVVATPEQGFVIKTADMATVLDQKLAQFGLNKQERNDFVEFWAPRLSKAPYYFVTFVPRTEIDRTAPLSVTPRPDTVIRVLMDYRPLAAPITVEPLVITPTERKGFTVVEWGGLLR
jgi:hypothetical protein